jgi:hypothetical protein
MADATAAISAFTVGGLPVAMAQGRAAPDGRAG